MNEYSTAIVLNASGAIAALEALEQRLSAVDKAIAQTQQNSKLLEASFNGLNGISGQLVTTVGKLNGLFEAQQRVLQGNVTVSDFYGVANEKLAQRLDGTNQALQVQIQQLQTIRSEYAAIGLTNIAPSVRLAATPVLAKDSVTAFGVGGSIERDPFQYAPGVVGPAYEPVLNKQEQRALKIQAASESAAEKAAIKEESRRLKVEEAIAKRRDSLQEKIFRNQEQLEQRLALKRDQTEQWLADRREQLILRLAAGENKIFELQGSLRLAQFSTQWKAQERTFFGANRTELEKLDALLLSQMEKRQSKEFERAQKIAELGIEAKKVELELAQKIAQIEFTTRNQVDRIERYQNQLGGSVAGATSAAGYPVTSGYGSRTHPIHGGTRFHDGIDIGAPTGTAISATMGGTVNEAFWNGGYGKYVSVTLENGVKMFFGHLSEIAVRAGQKFGAGDLLGRVGSTGTSTGPHLHLGSAAGDPSGSLPFLKLGGKVGATPSSASIAPPVSAALEPPSAQIAKVSATEYEKQLRGVLSVYDLLKGQVSKTFELEKAIAQTKSAENVKAYFADYLAGIDNQNAALQDQIAFAREYAMLVAANPSVRAEEVEAQLESVKTAEKLIEAKVNAIELRRKELNLEGVSNQQIAEYVRQLELKSDAQIQFNAELRREQAIAQEIRTLSEGNQKLRQSVADTLFNGSKIGLESEAIARLNAEYDIQKRKVELEQQFGADVLTTNVYLAAQFDEFSRLTRAQSEAEIAVAKLNERYETLRALSEGITGDFKSAIKSVLDGSKSASQAFYDLFKSVTSRILDMVLNALFKPLEQALTKFLDMAIKGLGNLFGGGGGASYGTGALGGFDPFDAAGALGSLGGLYGGGGGGGFSFTSIPGFANGGVLPGGFKAFADGGIATMPTLGLIGEGSLNEAVVPLPNGKSIPVQMSGGASRGGDGLVVYQTVQFQISALDARSVDQLLRERKGTIQSIVGDGVRRSQRFATTVRTS